jgi:hypothetical protein
MLPDRAKVPEYQILLAEIGKKTVAAIELGGDAVALPTVRNQSVGMPEVECVRAQLKVKLVRLIELPEAGVMVNPKKSPAVMAAVVEDADVSPPNTINESVWEGVPYAPSRMYTPVALLTRELATAGL